jgi:hypothetical protein
MRENLFLRKHSLYHEFEKVATKQELEYFVFGVLRNPMEITVTMFEKMKANTKGNFTNSKLFTENGGHISSKQRKAFNFIQDNKATFEEYFIEFFQKPYDNLVSLTIDSFDYIIRYENISDNYMAALKKGGVLNIRPLPIANKTEGKKKDIFEYYTDNIKARTIFVFGPFLEKYGYSFPEGWGNVRPSIMSRMYFRILQILRRINQKYFKIYPKKFGLQGTIYGDMQRKKLKDL